MTHATATQDPVAAYLARLTDTQLQQQLTQRQASLPAARKDHAIKVATVEQLREKLTRDTTAAMIDPGAANVTKTQEALQAALLDESTSKMGIVTQEGLIASMAQEQAEREATVNAHVSNALTNYARQNHAALFQKAAAALAEYLEVDAIAHPGTGAATLPMMQIFQDAPRAAEHATNQRRTKLVSEIKAAMDSARTTKEGKTR